MTEDKMVGWHHLLNGHEFEQTLGDGEGQGSLACCNPWHCKVLDMTKQLNKNNNTILPMMVNFICQFDRTEPRLNIVSGFVCVCVWLFLCKISL